MWACLSLLVGLCLLHGGSAETDGGGPRCQLAPDWKIGELEPMKGVTGRVTVVALLEASWFFCLQQASKLDGLRQKLENQGLRDVAYMVINHQGEQAQRLHSLLAAKLSDNIPLYRQDGLQPNVWQTLGGQKDDFFVYDRCGRLTHHIALPYSIIGTGHLETAIRDTYCDRICGECTHENAEAPEECQRRADVQPTGDTILPAEEEATGHHHGHHHGLQPRGGRGHDHHGHNGDHDQRGHSQHDTVQTGQVMLDDAVQRPVRLDLDQIQQVAGVHELAADDAAPIRPWKVGTRRWKSKHSWRIGGSHSTSWCWHWRRLSSDVEGEQSNDLWQCKEDLPASWQWQGPSGDTATNIVETWQWRQSPADWQPAQPAPWAWPLGVNWQWDQQ